MPPTATSQPSSPTHPPSRPSTLPAAAFLAAVQDIAGPAPTGLGTVDKAVEAINTVKVISALNSMAGLLKASLRCRSCSAVLLAGQLCCARCVPRPAAAPGRPTHAALAPSPSPPRPRAPQEQQQQQRGGAGGGASSNDMLQDLAAYLTLEKAQVGARMRAAAPA